MQASIQIAKRDISMKKNLHKKKETMEAIELRYISDFEGKEIIEILDEYFEL